MSDLLRVYKGGVLVGVLDKGDGEPFYGFTYDEAYLKMSSAMPLSLSLPLSACLLYTSPSPRDRG